MSETRLAGKVGLFVVITLILVGALLLTFSKGFTVFTPTYELRLKATSVGGLKPQSAVLISGVPIGRVTQADVAPAGRGVWITVQIQERYKIHADARFVIEQIGFLGDQYVAIYPGENQAPILEPGAEVLVEEPFNLQEVARSTAGLIERVDETVQTFGQAVERVDRTILGGEALTNLSVTVGNFRLVSERTLEMVDGVQGFVNSNTPALTTSVTNLVRFSEDLGRLAEELNRLVATNRAQLNSTIQNLESASGVVEGLAQDIDAGKGLAGSLFKDEQLRQNVAQAVENLTLLSSNLNKYGLLYKPKQKKKEIGTEAPVYPGRNPF